METQTSFDIDAKVLQGDTLAPYLYMICLDHVLRTSIDLIKENGFILKKMQEADDTSQKPLRTNAKNIPILASTPTQAESLHVDKTAYICFN